MAQLRELLDAGIIERGKSATGAPIHLVPKPRKTNPDGTLKEQTWRVVIDYRALNKTLKYTSHPTPNMEDTVGGLRNIALKQAIGRKQYDFHRHRRRYMGVWRGAGGELVGFSL